jgi:hypothetical protein
MEPITAWTLRSVTPLLEAKIFRKSGVKTLARERVTSEPAGAQLIERTLQAGTEIDGIS